MPDSRWVWRSSAWETDAATVNKPPAPTFRETDLVEKGRLYGPTGEILAVAYDRRHQPFGISPSDQPDVPAPSTKE